MYRSRTLSKVIEKSSQGFKAIMVSGMRQIGKTTFLKHIGEKDRSYVTLDNPNDLLMARQEPRFFLQTYKPPVLIDEIQYAPEILPYIKMFVDGADSNGQVWMTGSQQFLLMQGVTETLAGRVAIFDMLGFSLYEREGIGAEQKPFLPSLAVTSKLKSYDLGDTFKIIWKGFFPQMVLADDSQWSIFYGSYLKTYLERDVRQLLKVGDQMTFLKFLKVVAARTAQELNVADIARNVDIAPNTAKSWLSILEASGVIYLLQPYFNNISKRVVKKPKLYFTDTGLCAFLTDWKTPETLATGAMSGAFFETFVVMEILKSYYHNGESPSVYYYRDNAGVEIDLLISTDGLLHPIEIKKTSNPSKDMVKNFNILEKLGYKVGYGCLICLTDKMRPLTENINAISIWDI